MKRAVLAFFILEACATSRHTVHPIATQTAPASPATLIRPATIITTDMRPLRLACRAPAAPALPDNSTAPDLTTSIERLTARDKIHAAYERRLLAALKECNR